MHIHMVMVIITHCVGMDKHCSCFVLCACRFQLLASVCLWSFLWQWWVPFWVETSPVSLTIHVVSTLYQDRSQRRSGSWSRGPLSCLVESYHLDRYLLKCKKSLIIINTIVVASWLCPVNVSRPTVISVRHFITEKYSFFSTSIRLGVWPYLPPPSPPLSFPLPIPPPPLLPSLPF